MGSRAVGTPVQLGFLDTALVRPVAVPALGHVWSLVPICLPLDEQCSQALNFTQLLKVGASLGGHNDVRRFLNRGELSFSLHGVHFQGVQIVAV